MPELPKNRYTSVYLADNDHYCPFVIYSSGTHELPRDTQYLGVGVRIQVFNPNDEDEVALINKLQDQFVIQAQSTDPFAIPEWDQQSLNALRTEYEEEFKKFTKYPSDWQGPRGKVNEQTRHLAAAGAWGLFPEGGRNHGRAFDRHLLSGPVLHFWRRVDPSFCRVLRRRHSTLERSCCRD